MNYKIYDKYEIDVKSFQECRELQLRNIASKSGISRVEALDEAERVLIVREGEKIVGYAAFTTETETMFDLFRASNCHRLYKPIVEGIYIDQIVLDPDFRRQGVGRSMLSMLYHKFGRSIYLHVCVTNRPAMSFYNTMQFFPVGVYEREEMKGDRYVSFLMENEKQYSNILSSFYPD